MADNIRPLKPEERRFVHNMVYDGMNRLEAYLDAFSCDMSENSENKILRKADNVLKREPVMAYYEALMEEVRDRELNKAVWTKDVATQKLMKLVERAEAELEQEGKSLTVSRVNAIMQPIKELNLMHGLNTTNLNFNGVVPVQFSGEDDIPE